MIPVHSIGKTLQQKIDWMLDNGFDEDELIGRSEEKINDMYESAVDGEAEAAFERMYCDNK